MKRLAVICVVALPLLGLTKPLTRGDRVGVLRTAQNFDYAPERSVAKAIQTDLRAELEARGFKAFNVRQTFADIQRGEAPAADYYVEIVSANAARQPVGGVGTGVGGVAVDVGVVVSRVAAELRLYDGRTLELLERYDLRKKSTAVVPMGIGIGTRPFWAFIALPFVQYGQYRSAAHEVAREAADRIAQR